MFVSSMYVVIFSLVLRVKILSSFHVWGGVGECEGKGASETYILIVDLVILMIVSSLFLFVKYYAHYFLISYSLYAIRITLGVTTPKITYG